MKPQIYHVDAFTSDPFAATLLALSYMRIR